MKDFRDRTSRILNHAKKNFGDPCVLNPDSDEPFPFDGIFDNAHMMVDVDTEQPVSATHPTLGVNLFDFEVEPTRADQVQLRNLIYKIIDILPDGQGGATLVLHQVDHGQKVFKKKTS
jgi:hypothetical protein